MNVRGFFKHWDEVRANLFRALDLLSDDQLGFVPREGLWSLGEVALHIANAEEGWFRFGIAREHDEWPAAYSAADYPTVKSVKALLTEVHERTLSYLDTLSMADLEKQIEAPWGEHFRLSWIIWHVIDHELHHRGEIYLMLGLMGLEAPEI
jgi:uncharacterized damage-inducible protein DinB